MKVVDTRRKFNAAKVHRGSQVIFGERAHLLEVLQSISRAKLPRTRKQAEAKLLQKLIATRTEELNRITRTWDRRFNKARDPNSSPEELLRLGAALSKHDYLLARVLTEHKEAPPELLAHLASHPYAAVRENVARHPSTPESVLRKLAEVATEPLWFLVACNPSCPSDLRPKLKAKMQAYGSSPS